MLEILVIRFYTYKPIKHIRFAKDNKSQLYFSCATNRILSVRCLVQAWTLLAVLSSGLARKPTGNVAITSSTILQRIPYTCPKSFVFPHCAGSTSLTLLWAILTARIPHTQKLLLYSNGHNFMYVRFTQQNRVHSYAVKTNRL